PRRTRAGALTAALTWGLFGLATGGGVAGLLTWAVIGAVCGGVFAYIHERVLTKDEISRLATRLPIDSSALLTFANANDPTVLLEAAAANQTPTIASLAIVDTDLTASVLRGPAVPSPTPPADAPALAMILARYPDSGTAKRIASQVTT